MHIDNVTQRREGAWQLCGENNQAVIVLSWNEEFGRLDLISAPPATNNGATWTSAHPLGVGISFLQRDHKGYGKQEGEQ